MNFKIRFLLGFLLMILLIEIYQGNGITYDTNNTFDQQTTVPTFFTIYLLSPNTNPARNAWSLMMSEELPKIGIGTELYQFGWTLVIPRTFGYEPASPSDGIPIFVDGGYDIFFISLSSSLQYDPSYSYSSAYYSPAGNNFAYFQNSTMDSMISQYVKLNDPTSQLPIGYQIQQIAYQEAPYIPILNSANLWAHSSTLPWTQTDFLMIENQNYASYWSKLPVDTLSGTNLVYDDPYTLNEFMPGIVQSYVADIYLRPQISYMYERNPNDPNYALQPVMATSAPTYSTYNSISGAENMTITIHDDIRFSNGDPMTAYDVVNTYHYAMTPGFGFTQYSNYMTFFDVGTYGNDSVIAVNNNTIVFRLSHPYFLSTALTNEAVLDHNVVGWWNSTNWTSGSWSTNNWYPGGPTVPDWNANPSAFAVFTGPYMYDQVSLANALITSNVKILKNFNWWGLNTPYFNTWWGGSTQKISSLLIKYVSTKDAAINDLSVGSTQVLDGQYGIVYGDIANQASISGFTVSDLGIQMMSVNMHHPILGTGLNTPLGISDPSKAALAAKFIRQAIAYMVPQQDIIDSILKGVGSTATTLWPNLAVGYDNYIPVRQFDLAKAKSLMKLAGYIYPSSDTNTNTNINNKNDTNSNSNSNDSLKSLLIPLPIFNSIEITLSFMIFGILVRKRKIQKQ